MPVSIFVMQSTAIGGHCYRGCLCQQCGFMYQWILQLAAGLGLIITVYLFLRRLSAGTLLSTAAAGIGMLYVLQWVVLGPITPDIFLTWFTVLLLIILRAFVDRPSVSLAVCLGIIGALMYFSKGFGLYLFVAVVGLVIVWQLLTRILSFRVAIKRYLPLALVFISLVLPFIGILSIKYKTFTINNAGLYDRQVFSPSQKGLNPYLYTGPFKPPNNTAISVWEDPTALMSFMPSWSPLASKNNFEYFWNKVLGANLGKTIKFLWGSDILLGVGVVVLSIGTVRRWHFQREFVASAITSLLLVFGYAVIFSEDRYLWTIVVISLLCSALALSDAQKAGLINKVQLTALVLVVGFFMGQSLYSQITTVHNNGEVYDGERALTNQLGQIAPHHANIISDNFYSYYECYYWQDRCFAVLDPPADTAQQITYYKRLRSLDVNYYLDLHSSPHNKSYDKFISTYYKQIYDLPNQATLYKLN